MQTPVFADMQKVTAAAARLTRAQANFDAHVELCNKVMLPLHEELDAANRALKEIVIHTANDEKKGISAAGLSLDAAVVRADQQEQAQVAAAQAAAALAAVLAVAPPANDVAV